MAFLSSIKSVFKEKNGEEVASSKEIELAIFVLDRQFEPFLLLLCFFCSLLSESFLPALKGNSFFVCSVMSF